MSQLESEPVFTDKTRRRPDFPGNNLVLVQLQKHLNECSADLEDILFLQFALDDGLKVAVQIVEDAVKSLLVFDDFLDSGDGLDLVVVHERDVFIFEDFLPSGLLVQLLDHHLLSALGVFSAEERVGFCFGYLFKDAILLHNFIINSLTHFLFKDKRKRIYL